MNILIVDDEPLASNRLNDLIDKIPGCRNVGTAADGIDAVYKAYDLDIDIILMDISLPRMDGLEAARHIREFERPPIIIFTTAYPDHALEAFSVHASGYLMKPIRHQDLVEVLNFAQSTSANKIHEPVFYGQFERNHICCRNSGELQLIALNKIYCMRSAKKFTQVVHQDGTSLTEKSLKQFAAEFSHRLMQVHRNTIINKAFLNKLRRVSFNHYEVLLQGIEDPIVVSRRHLPKIRKHLKSFMVSQKIIQQREFKLKNLTQQK